MQKVVARVFDTTGAAAGAVTANLLTESIDGLIIVAITAGAAAATGLQVSTYDPVVGSVGTGDAAPGRVICTLTAPAIAGSAVYYLGHFMPGTANAVPAGGSYGCWLGRFTQVTGTGGAGSTLRYLIYSVRVSS